MSADLERLLGDLLDAWTAAGAPIAHSLRPGLTDDEIDAVVAPLQLALPDDVRALWRWRDGAAETTRNASVMGGPNWIFEPLAQTAELCLQLRERARENEVAIGQDRLGGLRWWEDDWWPIVGRGNNFVVADCRPTDAPPVIRSFDWWDGAPTPTTHVVHGLAELIPLWLAALRSGAWSWNQEWQQWQYDDERLPEWVFLSGLA